MATNPQHSAHGSSTLRSIHQWICVQCMQQYTTPLDLYNHLFWEHISKQQLSDCNRCKFIFDQAANFNGLIVDHLQPQKSTSFVDTQSTSESLETDDSGTVSASESALVQTSPPPTVEHTLAPAPVQLPAPASVPAFVPKEEPTSDSVTVPAPSLLLATKSEPASNTTTTPVSTPTQTSSPDAEESRDVATPAVVPIRREPELIDLESEPESLTFDPTCPKCFKTFKTYCQLSIHYKMTHEQGQLFKCDQCPRIFASQGSLNVHLQGHATVKPDPDDDAQPEPSLQPSTSRASLPAQTPSTSQTNSRQSAPGQIFGDYQLRNKRSSTGNADSASKRLKSSSSSSK